MIYILDTDILSLLGQGSSQASRIRSHIAQLPADDVVVTTVITFEEQMRGWTALLKRTKSFGAEVGVYARLLDHLATFRQLTVLPFDEMAAQTAAGLKSQKIRIGTMDLKIAAITLGVNGILVTRNSIDFERVRGLVIEDWAAD